jgi:hypothetical protein
MSKIRKKTWKKMAPRYLVVSRPFPQAQGQARLIEHVENTESEWKKLNGACDFAMHYFQNN